ncbi:hypothetical protein BUALT_Bualt14G0098300 [Buddleja alternifolia]|uniref:Uncharacterized protein n=1 Tax=Buddleja alternifolia TaxID=168488 RepID=A0AAV6WHQ6_9LAMI|nr:hypothetical protein BUALT_Bualt14G0098300 [Buddleja alternifolia]
MAAVLYAPVLAVILILVLQSNSAIANFTIPFLSPIFGNACEENVCGRGHCVASTNSNFGFECECEAGWKQARPDNDDNLKFLPCVVPNCTLDYACGRAPSPASDNQKRANFSFFDPCFWTDCGGGSCNRTSLFTHTCECEEDYYNLFNTTAFPCYKQCALGMDCARLGIGFGWQNSSRPNSSPNLADNSNSRATNLIPRVEFGWLITIVTTLTLVVSKYS